jgi:hypothetical protein
MKLRHTISFCLAIFLAEHASAINHIWLAFNPSTTACQSQTVNFFNCILGQTNFNQLAAGFPYGEPVAVGGAITLNPPCNDGDFQCVVNQGQFPLAPYDIVMQYSGTGWSYGWNGTATVSSAGRSVLINTAFVYSGNSCEGQTCLGAHEAFEGATDGISADCCNGQVHSNSCPNCDSSCGRDYGNNGNPPWGCYPLTCGGATYYMELLAKNQQSETDISGCVQLTVTGSGSNDPCSGVSAGNGGLYCGTSTENGFSGGIPNDLYDCQNSATASKTPCQYGCTVEPAGTNDKCNPAPSDPCAGTTGNNGLYCGLSHETGFAGGDPDTLYNCQNGVTAGTTHCPYGCTVAPAGTNDYCNAPPPADAGEPGMDGGPKHADAGEPSVDAGSEQPDAGFSEDSGPEADASSAKDAGEATTDAAGAPEDDAGADASQPNSILKNGGCSCGGEGASLPVTGALAFLAAIRRRRASSRDDCS